jgi:dihydrofolate reductase
MGNVVIDMSMSLDGYIAAPNDNPEQGLGEDGMRLHNWAFDDPSVFERVYGNLVEETGAVIMGRRSYDNSIEAWGGKGPLGEVPCFVVTHRPPATGPGIHVRHRRDRGCAREGPGGRRREADRADGREHRPAIPRRGPRG